ncbi:MAG: hypothetical protein KC609_19650 [Myxococcales bacterium]|nr:hypothetical protein [Myxococcales bacterium]
MDPQLFLIANIALDESGYRAWRGLELDRSAFAWLEGEPIFNGDAAPIASRVEELVGRLGEVEGIDGNSFVELQRDGVVLTLVGALVGEEAIVRWHEPLATACRLCGQVGGRGELCALMAPLGFGVQVTIGGDHEIELVEHDELAELFRPHTGTISMISSWLLARANDPNIDRDAFFRYARSLGLGRIDEAPLQQQVLARLAEVDSDDLFAAATQVVALHHAGTVAETFGSAQQLEGALSRADRRLRVQGIELLASLFPVESEPIAFQLLEDPSSFVREAAMRSMAYFRSERALRLLLELRDTLDAMGLAQEEAVARSAHPQIDQRLVALLEDPELFGPESYAAIDDPSAVEAELEACDATYRRAYQVIVFIQRRAIHSAAPRLVELFLEPPVRAMRDPLALALETIGGPDVEAIATKIHHFRFGMGLALNQDDTRRREILGIVERERDDGGIMHFEDLTFDELTQLLEEQFIDPEARQNEAPSTLEFYEFMEQWPEVTAHGYAVSIDRDDYRIHLEGLYCDLDEVDEERRDELKEAFEELCGEATQYEVDEQSLYAWWT